MLPFPTPEAPGTSRDYARFHSLLRLVKIVLLCSPAIATPTCRLRHMLLLLRGGYKPTGT